MGEGAWSKHMAQKKDSVCFVNKFGSIYRWNCSFHLFIQLLLSREDESAETLESRQELESLERGEPLRLCLVDD